MEWAKSLGDTSSIIGIFYWQYFLYFAFGVLVKKYFNKFQELLDSKWFLAVAIPMFVIAFLMRDVRHVIVYIITFLGIIITFAFFRNYGVTFTQETWVGRSLQYIGRRTLDIYLMHYFFLPYHMDSLGNWLDKNANITIELFCFLVLALMTIAICLVASAVFRMSPNLRWLILGQKR